MPDQHPRSHRISWHLSTAVAQGQLVWVECGYCRVRRHYLPDDLRRPCGYMDVNALSRRMRCDSCRRGDGMTADVILPCAAMRARLTIHRLAGIQIRKIPVWRDEPP